jgi:hypothetical protein
VVLLLFRRTRAAIVPASIWTVLTGRFAAQRIAPGPRTPVEIGRMLASSALIPPVACYHRFRGELAARLGSTRHPRYVWTAVSGPPPARHPESDAAGPAGGPRRPEGPRWNHEPGSGPPVRPRKDLP